MASELRAGARDLQVCPVMHLGVLVCLPISALLACTSSTTSGPDRHDGPDPDLDGGAVDAGTVEFPSAADASVADAAPPADAARTCASSSIARFSGTAHRENDLGYPDAITATVTWDLVGTSGCVDTYAPSGVVDLSYGIPGALCTQTISPASHDIAAGDGSLTIDRSTSAPTYSGAGSTTWTFTFHCVYDDGTYDDSQIVGGGRWLAATATVVDGAISGSYNTQSSDGSLCGPEHVAPCTYTWSFTGS